MERTPLSNVLKRTRNRTLARFCAAIAKRLFEDGVPDWLSVVIERTEDVARGWGSAGWDFGYENLEALRAQRSSGESRWLIPNQLTSLIESVNRCEAAEEYGPMERQTDPDYAEELVYYRDEIVESAIGIVELATAHGLDIMDVTEMYARVRWPGVAKRDPDRFDAAVVALAVGHDDVARSIIYRRRAQKKST
jgi:hypothetical protein